MKRDEQNIHDINVDEEWTHFKNRVRQEAVAEKAKLYKWVAVAAAASVLVIAGALLWQSYNKSAPLPVATVTEQPAATPAVVTRYATNTTTKAQQVALQDGSIVVLEPASELHWQEPFTSNRRDIYLTGQARFTVAKDKTKPFTVFSGAIATTALGTQFIISAFARETHISVRLYEGKVVVKAADSLHPKLKNNFFLLPGEELVYDNARYTASVQRFINNNATAHAPEPAYKDEPVLPRGEKESWYMFNNQPLAQVFDQLQELFGVTIEYSNANLSKMYFIGKFSKQDSLSHILYQIAKLNNLTITRLNDKFIISQ